MRGGESLLFLVEAELDALLLWQAAGDLVDVVPLGSVSRTLPARWLAAVSARITPVRTPAGNDMTEYLTLASDSP